MRSLLVLLFIAFSSVLHGGGAEEPLTEPKALLRIIEALENSKEDSLVSKASSDGGLESYHLRSVNLLGTVARGKETFFLAEVFYVRSRP